jgi:hypothetical protein
VGVCGNPFGTTSAVTLKAMARPTNTNDPLIAVVGGMAAVGEKE